MSYLHKFDLNKSQMFLAWHCGLLVSRIVWRKPTGLIENKHFRIQIFDDHLKDILCSGEIGSDGLLHVWHKLCQNYQRKGIKHRWGLCTEVEVWGYGAAWAEKFFVEISVDIPRILADKMTRSLQKLKDFQAQQSKACSLDLISF